jgi:hypothetical protein
LPIDSTLTQAVASAMSSGHCSQPSTCSRRQTVGLERHARQIENRRAHVHGDAAVGLQFRLDEARERLHPDATFGG